MTKTLSIPGLRPITIGTCYGLPSLFGLVIVGSAWLTIWSHYTPPVVFTSIKVEQVGDGGFVTLKLTKFVNWDRLCPGWAEQEIRPLIAVNNPKRISSQPIKLDGHVINTPSRKGPNAREGDPTPERLIVLAQGSISPGRWQFKITPKMSCFWWEYIFPIESQSATTEFDVH